MNIIVSVPIDENLAAFIGKKGSANSITFYNRKLEDDVLVALFPSQEEGKVYALAESLLVAAQVVLSTANVDKRFGEALVASSLLNRKLLITDDNDVSALLKSAGVTNYTVVSRNDLLDKLHSGAVAPTSQGVRVDIDKAFPVKGIGTVVLGIVTKGTLKQHDKLFHTSGKEVLVRSMQSQDVDITAAEPGTRVGVSLKDIGEDEIEKGDLLTSGKVDRRNSIIVEYKSSVAANEKIAEESLYGIVSNFSYSECIVKKVGDRTLELALRTPIPFEKGDEVLLLRKTLPRIFASGIVS